MENRSVADAMADNAILAGLPEVQRRKLIDRLEEVDLQQGTVLHENGESPNSAYFLTEGVAALTLETDDGKHIALSLVGREGVMGERAIFEGGLELMRCIMVTDGHGYRMLPGDFSEEFHEGGKLHDLVMRTLEARLAETSQTALCNQMHTVEQRVCRWLLSFVDRIFSKTLPLTHEEIADLLGVGRPGVTVILSHLREAKLLDTGRGHITIIDKAGLEKRSCECYAITKDAVKTAYDPRHKTKS